MNTVAALIQSVLLKLNMAQKKEDPTPVNPAKKVSLPPEELIKAVEVGNPLYIEIILDSPTLGEHNCFLDTTLNYLLYQPPIFNGLPDSNYSVQWTLELAGTPVGLGPYKIANYVTYNANTAQTEVAYLRMGANISQGGPEVIFEVVDQGPHQDIYLEHDAAKNLYAIYFDIQGSNNAYLLPFTDPAQLGARGKYIHAVIDSPNDKFVFKIRAVL